MTKKEKKVKIKKGSKKNKSKESKKDETNRSRVYEDDQNTFRLVNFGQKQSSVQQLNQYSSKNIDFYSNNPTIEPHNLEEKGKIEEGLPQKISFIHIEESPEDKSGNNNMILK